PPVRIGYARARVRIAVPHAVARRAALRGSVLQDDDVEARDGEVANVPLRRLPTVREIVSGRALRNLNEGDVVSSAAVTVAPAVRSGQEVRASVMAGGAEVTASLTAAQDGEPGAIIRVVNRDSRRQLKARVVSQGVVEVIHE